MNFLQNHTIGILGIICNSIAVIILIKQSVSTSNDDIVEESIVYCGYNKQQMYSIVDSRDNNAFTTIYTGLGILFSVADLMGGFKIQNRKTLFVVIFFMIVFVIVSFLGFRKINLKNKRVVEDKMRIKVNN